jgi:hypothetical protein
MLAITRQQLVQLLLNPTVSGINGASFIGLDTVTVPTLKGGKSNPMKDRVEKCSTGHNVIVFQNKNSNGYSNMVKRRLEAEGKNPETFELKPRRWGVRIEGTPLVEHKGNYYFEVIFLNAGKSTYLLDGKPIKKELVQGLDLDKEEGSQGGLNDKVIIRTYKIASISRITINKETYMVVD